MSACDVCEFGTELFCSACTEAKELFKNVSCHICNGSLIAFIKYKDITLLLLLYYYFKPISISVNKELGALSFVLLH
jgi:hypothetical protein